MVRIRLRRVGLKRQASYRIVVTDKRSPRDGRYIEIIGFYNPRTQPETVEYQEERALHWLSVGASPTEAVEKFFRRNGTYDRLARLHKGESMEVLVAEADAATAAAEPISPKTKYPAPIQSKAKRQQEAVIAEAVAEAPVAVAEALAEAEEEAQEEPVEEVVDEVVEVEDAAEEETTEEAEEE
jgi:small subunit ribosomal protein S16